jgi:ribokinase
VSVRAAVVGHVELVEFLCVERLPRRGEVAHSLQCFTRAAGGGGVAAGVLAELGAEVELFTALGDDDAGAQAHAQLQRHGARVHAALRRQPTRRAVSLLEHGGDRAIVTIGERLAPAGSDPLPWQRIAGAAAVYFTAGDAEALTHARRARALVATPRAGEPLSRGPRLDALIWSAHDPRERELAGRLAGAADVLIETDGANGGRWRGASEGSWEALAPPGPVLDSYGAGDAFAAAVALALGTGASIADAVACGAQWGARMLTRRGAP